MIGGGIFTVAGVVLIALAFPPAGAAVAAAAVATAASVEIPIFSGFLLTRGAVASGLGLSHLFSSSKTDSPEENLPFHLIPPEEFVEGKIYFKLRIGKVTNPLKVDE